MIAENSLVYLETSAVNFFTDLENYEPKLTRAFHGSKGTRFCVSPVTIWEILLTGNENRRERLIYCLQNLGWRQLLPSPAELILNYIKAGCPVHEPIYELKSLTRMAAVWEDVADHDYKSIMIDQNDLQKRTTRIRRGFQEASAMIEEVGITTTIMTPIQEARFRMEQMVKQMKSIPYEKMSDLNRRQYKISLILIGLILCAGMGDEDTVVEDYWKDLGIQSSQDRFAYLIKYYEKLIYQGPFAVLSAMVLTQMEIGAKPTRGIFWDVLHSVYLIYTDYFLTTDNHFKLLKDKNDHINYQKIILLTQEKILPAKGVKYL